MVGEEEAGLGNLYPISLYYPYKMEVWVEPGSADGGGGGGGGDVG
jgi:hypothetical protein